MSQAYNQAILNKSRSDKFTLVVGVPNILKDFNKKGVRNNKNVDLEKIQYSIYGTIAPRIQVPAIEARYSGSTVNVSSHSHPAYAPITVKFAIDNMFYNYWFIYSWLNALRDEREGVVGVMAEKFKAGAGQVYSLEDYATTFTVYGKDEFNKNVIKWDYLHAFPTQLSEIDYNYQTANEIQSSFEFVFHEVNVTLLDVE